MSRRSKILPFTSHFTDVAGLFFLLLVSSAAQGKHYVYGLHQLLSYLASRVGKGPGLKTDAWLWIKWWQLGHHKAHGGFPVLPLLGSKEKLTNREPRPSRSKGNLFS